MHSFRTGQSTDIAKLEGYKSRLVQPHLVVRVLPDLTPSESKPDLVYRPPQIVFVLVGTFAPMKAE